MNDFNYIFIDDVKSIKKENIELKIRVQQLENEMETVKKMLKTIIIDKTPTDEETSVIQKNLLKKSLMKKLLKKKFNQKQCKKRQIQFYTKYFCFKKWRSTIEFKQKIKMAQYVTCTPINLTNTKSETHIDYFKQVEKYNDKNCEMRWDDTAYNNSLQGNLFAFVKSNDEMQIHLITKIGNTKDREPYWSERERNVVFLSKQYFTMTWTYYKERTGYQPNFSLRGTQRLKWY